MANYTNSMKELVAEILEDLEVARRDFARALVKFSEMDEPLVLNNHKSNALQESFESNSSEEIFQPVSRKSEPSAMARPS